jgi:excisionase family DNA binding protein
MSADALADHSRPPVNHGSIGVSPASRTPASQTQVSRTPGQTPGIIRHLALALPRHVRRLRQDGVPVPVEVDEWAAFLVHSAGIRPELTVVDDDPGGPQHAPVVARLLVTKAEAAERLSVSERTIERLVAAGRLPLVHVERTARIRVSDLEAFVHRLAEGQLSQPGPSLTANAHESTSCPQPDLSGSDPAP